MSPQGKRLRRRRTRLRGATGALRAGLLAACAALLLCGGPAAAAGQVGAALEGPQGADTGVDLLRLAPGLTYRQWRERGGWEDRRPFSDSARRFRIEDGTLRLESDGESYLIGRALSADERRNIDTWPYLRFQVRIGDVPRGARLAGEERDDAAFRIYAVFRDSPPQALAYVWSWELPVGAWSARSWSIWGDFRDVHRKAFGQGEPAPDTWLTVEVDLRADFQARFPGQPLPVLIGVGLKADSNDTPGGHSLAWLRAASLHRTSLREAGHREGERLGGTVLWFR